MVGNHSVAAGLGQIISDVNLNFPCSQPQIFFFFFLPIWYPIVFASSGHYALSQFGLQDTLSYKVLKKMCNTGAYSMCLAGGL